MCGRFTVQHNVVQIVARFEAEGGELTLEKRFNIAPSQPIAVVTVNSPRRLQMMDWGLVPFWADDPSIGNKMINAKAETLAEKPSFKYALTKRRCLIPADGFY